MRSTVVAKSASTIPLTSVNPSGECSTGDGGGMLVYIGRPRSNVSTSPPIDEGETPIGGGLCYRHTSAVRGGRPTWLVSGGPWAARWCQGFVSGSNRTQLHR